MSFSASTRAKRPLEALLFGVDCGMGLLKGTIVVIHDWRAWMRCEDGCEGGVKGSIGGLFYIAEKVA
jgi:hypothetical protein